MSEQKTGSVFGALAQVGDFMQELEREYARIDLAFRDPETTRRMVDDLRAKRAARSSVIVSARPSVPGHRFDEHRQLKRFAAFPARHAQIESQFSQQAQTRGLWLRCRPTDGVVTADRLALWRIASNLVTNALEATSQGGVLVAWRAHRRTLEVRDSGRGIAAEDHETVFQEFRRLPASSRNARGLGLGLATVRRLAQLMGTTVTLRSAPGRGSVFSLGFPAEAVTIAPAEGSWIPQQEPAPRVAVRVAPGTRVLAVDDDPAILAAIDALLSQWGFEVRVAADCAAAATVVTGEWVPALMIFDRRLPDGDGAAMAATLRGRIRPEPACLIITGDTAPDDLRALRGSGFDVLHKPVSPAQLVAALRSLGMLAQSPEEDLPAPRMPG